MTPKRKTLTEELDQTPEAKTTPTNGGSSQVTVETAPEAEIAEELSDAAPSDGDISTSSAINEAMIESLLIVVGNLLVLASGYDELDFTESEVMQLKSVWGGLLPETSPLTSAIICTAIIVGGKFVMYKKLQSDKGENNDAEKVAGKAAGSSTSPVSKSLD